MSVDANVENENSGETSLHVAAIQMEANSAPTAERLARAERLVVSAVEAGAQLVLLPECFNTGYTFSEENHARVESIDGPTATWLHETAARYSIHLAGSLMLLEQGEDLWCARIGDELYLMEMKEIRMLPMQLCTLLIMEQK